MSLLDLGLDTASSSATQSQQPQEQQSSSPFGDPQRVAQQPNQQTNYDDPFGAPQQPTQNPSTEAIQQEQQQQPGFDTSFTDQATPAPAPQQILNPNELNFGVFEEQKNPTQNQNEQQTQETAVAPLAATANGSAATESSAEVGKQPSPVDAENAANEATEATVLDTKDKLKEIESVFGGRWRLLRSDPYGEYLKAVGTAPDDDDDDADDDDDDDDD
ncbi:hypothetical protein ElyMa_001667200 [Elysia marginata]|uniref:Uncharacterized protein n=1 Tax=Elysia marginata TaxID=1093978 RepID=A0AAV4JQC4_9GAST|nr:hypothetical protein ElyMa_001667200 [Elysia marginata]